jgi:Response regulator receiver domain
MQAGRRTIANDCHVARVLAVDDHPPFLVIVRELLRATRYLDGVGEAGSGEEAVEVARRLRPALVLMDVRMPGMGGVAPAKLINEASSAAGCLAGATMPTVRTAGAWTIAIWRPTCFDRRRSRPFRCNFSSRWRWAATGRGNCLRASVVSCSLWEGDDDSEWCARSWSGFVAKQCCGYDSDGGLAGRRPMDPMRLAASFARSFRTIAVGEIRVADKREYPWFLAWDLAFTMRPCHGVRRSLSEMTSIRPAARTCSNRAGAAGINWDDDPARRPLELAGTALRCSVLRR